MRFPISVMSVLFLSSVFIVGCNPIAGNSSEAASKLVAEAIMMLEHGQMAEAKERLQKAVRTDRNHADAYKVLGDVQAFQNELADAEKNYLKAIKLAPASGQPHNGLGRLYLKMNRADDAIDQFRMAVSKEPTLEDAYFNMGVISYSVGKTEMAVELLKKVLQLNPNHEPAKKQLFQIASQLVPTAPK